VTRRELVDEVSSFVGNAIGELLVASVVGGALALGFAEVKFLEGAAACYALRTVLRVIRVG